MTSVGDQATRSAPALGKTRSNSSPGDARWRRTTRRAQRRQLRRITTLDSVRTCGLRPIMQGGTVSVRLSDDGHAGLHGLQTCGSPWSCSVCSAKIDAERGKELEQLILGAVARGYVLAFLTLTLRHRRAHRLARLLDAVGCGWTAVTSGKRWATDGETHGIPLGGARDRIGCVRRLETPYGEANGWHPHLHVLLTFRVGTTRAEVEAVTARMVGRWVRAIERGGFDAPLVGRQDVRLLEPGDDVAGAVATYMAKGVAMELSQTRTKTRRSADSTENPWAIVGRFLEDGDRADLELWSEYEQATKGRRAMTWSNGLRAHLLGSEVERTDEEIAAEEVGSEEDTVLVVFAGDVARLLADERLELALVDVTEAEGPMALSRLLTAAGIQHYVTPRGRAWVPGVGPGRAASP